MEAVQIKDREVECLKDVWNVSLRVQSSWEQRKCSCKVT